MLTLNSAEASRLKRNGPSKLSIRTELRGNATWPVEWSSPVLTTSWCRLASFQGKLEIRTCGLCVRAAVLYQLSYEDPYTGGLPIYWVHQPVKGMKHRMKLCELREFSFLPSSSHEALRNHFFHWPLKAHLLLLLGIEVLFASFIYRFVSQ